jgi:hypothetical protein
MVNVLISVNADLGSSIALRYARGLSKKINMQLHGIHVIDPKRMDRAPGSGWVRHTWENALIETEKEEIRLFLEVEKAGLPFLKVPRMVIGDRTDGVLEELHRDDYHLFMEGVPPTTNPDDFYKLIHSRLYQMLPCPVLVVKNLLTPLKAALLLDDKTDFTSFSPFVDMFFKTSEIVLEPIFLKFSNAEGLTLKEVDAPDFPLKNFDLSAWMPSKKGKIVEGSEKTLAAWLREYGVVASSLDHMPDKNDPMVVLLSRVSSPVLVCWR